MTGRHRLLVARGRTAIPFRHLIPGVLVFVTVDTQQLPVAAVRRIVVVIVILVMDREFSNLSPREFSPASGTDPRKNLEGSLPIGLLSTLSKSPGLVDNLIRLVDFCLGLLG